MDIIQYAESLQARIKLLHGVPAQSDTIARGKALGQIRAIVAEMKQFLHKYTFKSVQEEITFFKEIKPVIISHFYYHKKVFSLAIFDDFRDRAARKKNYNLTLVKMEAYARRHKDLYEYFIAGSTTLDRSYFTHEGRQITGINADEKFTTGTDIILARFIAHRMIQEFVTEALTSIDKDQATPTLPWAESKVAMVELIYALHASKAFGREDIKKIVKVFEEVFGVELGNYARTFGELQLRKSGRTTFLDTLRKSLVARIENAEDL
jgi:predicted nucleic-acid-binding protein